MTYNASQKSVLLSALVREEDAKDLLLQLANDDRVTAVNVRVGEAQYLVPERMTTADGR